MRKSDEVRVHHEKKSDGVRVDHEKKSDGVRVHHEKKSDGVRVDDGKKSAGVRVDHEKLVRAITLQQLLCTVTGKKIFDLSKNFSQFYILNFVADREKPTHMYMTRKFLLAYSKELSK